MTDQARSFDRPLPLNSALGRRTNASPYTSAERPIDTIKSTTVTNFNIIDSSNDDSISMINPFDSSAKIARKTKLQKGQVNQTVSHLYKKRESNQKTSSRKIKRALVPYVISSPSRATANRNSVLSKDNDDSFYLKQTKAHRMPGAFVYNPNLTEGRHSVGPRQEPGKKISGNSHIQYQNQTAKALRVNRGSLNCAPTNDSSGQKQNSLYTPLLFDDWLTSSQEARGYPSSNNTSKPNISQKQIIEAVLRKRSVNRFKEDLPLYKNSKHGQGAQNKTLQYSVTIHGDETDHSQVNNQYLAENTIFRSGPSPKRVLTTDALSSGRGVSSTPSKKKQRQKPFILANENQTHTKQSNIVATTALQFKKKPVSEKKTQKKVKSNWISNMYRRNQLLKNGIDLQPIRQYQFKQSNQQLHSDNSQSGWSLPQITGGKGIETPTKTNVTRASPTAAASQKTKSQHDANNQNGYSIAQKLEIFRDESDSASQVYSVSNPRIKNSTVEEKTYKRRIASVSGNTAIRRELKPATAALIGRPHMNTITQSVLMKKNKKIGGVLDKEDACKASFVIQTDETMTPQRAVITGYSDQITGDLNDTNNFELRTSIGMLSRPDNDEVKHMETIENMPEGAIFAVNQYPANMLTPNSQKQFGHSKKHSVISSKSKDMKLDMGAYYQSVNLSTSQKNTMTPVKNKNYTRASTHVADGYISPKYQTNTVRVNKVCSPIGENINITVLNKSGFLPGDKIRCSSRKRKTPKPKRNGARAVKTCSPGVVSSKSSSKVTSPSVMKTRAPKIRKSNVSTVRSTSKSPKKSFKKMKKSTQKHQQSSKDLLETIPPNPETVIEKQKNAFLNPKLFSMGEDPAFFNLFIEKRHAEHLAKKDLDEESRLEVIYRVLKDQLRSAKKGLLVLKKEKDNDRRRALELKRRIQIAQAKAGKDSIAKNVISQKNNDGETVLKYVGQDDNLTPELRAIVERLVNSDKRKHYKYCPSCKNYEEGQDPTPEQMGEFIEFIRQQHYKLFGMPTSMRKIRPRDQKLEHDSVSEITDLSDDGILTQSMHLLSQTEQKRLKRYMSQFKTFQGYTVPKHDCFGKKKKKKGPKVNNSRFVVEMQLRSKSEPKEFDDKSVSAHQFSYRDISIQADSEERFEIAMQTSLIDLKSNYQQVDVYDLEFKRDVGMQKGNPQVGIKEMKDQAVGTDLCRRMLSTNDWFYSDLYRRLLKLYFKKNRLKVTKQMQEDWKNHDENGHYRGIEEPAPRQSLQLQTLVGHANKNSTTQDGFTNTENFNPQDDDDNKRFPYELKVLSEPEITYLLNIYKGKVEKWSSPDVLQEIHQNSCHTAKSLIKEMIEGQTPLCFIIEKYTTVDVNSVKTLLYRCSKLYQTRQDVKKIILLLIKLEHSAKEMSKAQELQLWIRLSSLLGQFQTENRGFHGEFMYKGKNLLIKIDEKLKFLKVAAARVSQKSVEEQKCNNAFHSKDIKEILREEAKADKQIGQGASSTNYLSKLIQRQEEYAKRGKQERSKTVKESDSSSLRKFSAYDSKKSETQVNHNFKASQNSLDYQRRMQLIKEELMIEEGGYEKLKQLERVKQSDGDLLNVESQRKLLNDMSFQNRATPDITNQRASRNFYGSVSHSALSKSSKTQADIQSAQALKVEFTNSQANFKGLQKQKVRASLVNKEPVVRRSKLSLNSKSRSNSGSFIDGDEISKVKFSIQSKR